MPENNQSFIQKIFQSLKPYQVNKGQAQGISEVDAYESDYLYKSIYGTSTDKKRLFDEYKEMSMYPYAADAIDEIVHEAILRDKNGQVVKLNILDPDLSEKENVVKNLQKEFEYVVNKLLDFNTNSEDLFRKFYVEGELLAELVIDANKKEQGLKGVQYLPSYTMQIEYDDNNDPLKYIQSFVGMNMQTTKKNTTNNTQIVFEPTQIAYINSGIMDMKRRLVYSYLERAKVPFRQLKWMENALLVYRITRAPERRVFYIDIGKLPKSKADEYMKSIIRNFKNKKVYNPSTGEVEIGKDTLSMEEDFFFPTTSEGRGSKVETLPGACLSLDTKIPLLDGRTEKLSTIIEEFNMGKKLWIYSCNPETGLIVPGEVSWAGITRKDTEVVKITLDNGEELITTPDHKFPLWGKGKTEAKDLKEGDSFIPFNSKKEILFDNSDYEMIFNNQNKEWEFTHRMVAKYFKESGNENIFIYDDKFKNEKKDTIHHKDFNRFNNSPDNLVWMHNKDHRHYHANQRNFSHLPKEKVKECAKKGQAAFRKLLKENPEIKEAFLKKCSKIQKERCSKAPDEIFEIFSERMSQMVDKFRKDLGEEKYLIWHKEVSKKGSNARIKKQNEDLNFKEEVYKKSGSSLSKRLREDIIVREKNLKHLKNIQTPFNNQSVYYDEYMLKKVVDYYKLCEKNYPESIRKCSTYAKLEEVLNKLNEDKKFITYFKEKNILPAGNRVISKIKIDKFAPQHLRKMLKQFNYSSWKDFGQKIQLFNHRVIKIEHLSQRMDTGTLTIDGSEKYHNYHTFALASGIFTYNSNLGEITDVTYFLNKLYKALKIPITRLNPETQWAHGKPGEAGVSRDEIKFAKYVESIRNRFGDFIYQIFFTHLQLKGLVKLYQLDKSKLSIQFTENNSWKELKNLEMMRSRIDIFKDMIEFKDEIFPREFLLKSVMNLSDDEIKDIDEMLAKQKLGGTPSGEVPEEPVETPEEDTEVDVLLREPKADNLLIDRIKAHTI